MSLDKQLQAVDTWFNDIIALLSEGDGARVAALLGMPMPEFCEAVRAWRTHMRLQAKSMK